MKPSRTVSMIALAFGIAGIGAPVARAQSQAALVPVAAREQFQAAKKLLTDGKFADAAAAFKSVDSGAGDAALTSAARYNLGYALFQQGKSLLESQPGEAISALRQAASAYRAALDVSPNDAAAQGLEVTRRLIRQIQQQQKQQHAQPQQQDQQGQGSPSQNKNSGADPKNSDKTQPSELGPADTQNSNSQNPSQGERAGDKLRDLANRQREAAKQSDDSTAKNDPESGDPDKQKAAERAAAKQEEISKATQEARKELDAPAPSDPREQAGRASAQQKVDEAMRAQDRAAAALNEGKLGDAAEEQRRAADALDGAASDLNGAETRDARDTPESRARANARPKSAEPPRKPLDPVAQQLLDRERKQREVLRRLVPRDPRAKPAPVDKDW